MHLTSDRRTESAVPQNRESTHVVGASPARCKIPLQRRCVSCNARGPTEALGPRPPRCVAWWGGLIIRVGWLAVETLKCRCNGALGVMGDFESIGVSMDEELRERIERARMQFAQDEASTPGFSETARRLLVMGLAAHDELWNARFEFDTLDQREDWVRQAVIAEINWELDQPPADAGDGDDV